MTRQWVGSLWMAAIAAALGANEVMAETPTALAESTSFEWMPSPGDFNFNGQVEQGDLDQVLLNWGDLISDPAAIGWHNHPPQGIVDQAELDAVLLNWGAISPPATGVPEPSSLLLLLLAAGSLGLLARRR